VEILGLLLPFVAAMGWLWWIHHADRYEKEPWGLVLKTFGLGAAAGLIGLAALTAILVTNLVLTHIGALLLAPLHVALITVVLRLLPYRRLEWNEPFDGIVYGGAAGIGYGLVYTLVVLAGDPLLGFRSAVFTIPIYMLAGLIIGHYMSQVRFGAGRTWLKGFVIATLYLAGIELARTWGGEVMGAAHPLASAIVYGANTIGWIMAMWAMDQGTRGSQHHPGNYRLPLSGQSCPVCTAPLVAGAAFCNHCGRPLMAGQGVTE
jgi:RsiW-degrading membrane proteinase PrsW (M82 family)